MSPQELPLAWLQGGGCTGCTISLANSAFPSLRNILIDQILPGTHISLAYHPTLMAAQGADGLKLLDALPERGFVLGIEGSIPENEDFCCVGRLEGRELTVLDKFLELASRAALVMAVGTCSSFGGIPSAAPNPGKYRSASEIIDKNDVDVPLVNVPGCPPNPDWITTTLGEFLVAGAPSEMQLDALRRPLSIYGELIHENCPRRAYFDENKFAEKPGDPECLHELGCKGPITYADCPVRQWNNGTSWCVKAGGPCNGCTQPEYIDDVTPLYQKLPEDALPKIGEPASAGETDE